MRQQKILNTMAAFTFDEALRLANRKRDICNHKCWVVGGSGEFLIFARYQKKSLQSQGLLKPLLTGKDLDEMASYIAYPVNEIDRARRGKIRRFLYPGNQKDIKLQRKIETPR
jgi:hypothetical protein